MPIWLGKLRTRTSYCRLHKCAVQLATMRGFDAGDRTLGKWLAQEVQAGRKGWPPPNIAPLLFPEPLASYSGYCVRSS